MFLNQTVKRNQALIDISFQLQQSGEIEPDSYIVDVDTFLENASIILSKAKENGIHLFFMLKQIGRNPYLAKKLTELGYEGAVVVDYKEAQIMMEQQIPIGNIGHLVQIPSAQIEKVVAYGPKFITVYSEDKIKQINAAAKKLGVIQKILIRVYQENDMIYSGQTAGFHIDDISGLAEKIQADYANVAIAGVTSFPCYLFNRDADDIVPTQNLQTVLRAAAVLEQAGIHCEMVNTPSATCSRTLEKMKVYGGNCGEPGHGLTGTTPLHAVYDLEEIPCVTYVSEISHNFMGKAYCFGGGYYRRSHVEHALVGTNYPDAKLVKVIPPTDESIDYHFGLSEECEVGDAVVMAFRYQIFVTRSDVVLVEGLKNTAPRIAGIYDSLGREK